MVGEVGCGMEQQIWTRLTHGIIQVRIPVPFSLRWINSYIIPEQESFTIIDPGLRTEESIEVWKEVLSQLQLEWSQCNKIVITHQHPDHYGLAGYVQEKSGAPVFMTEESYQYTIHLWGGGKAQYEQQMSELLHEHGVPITLVQSILLNLREFEVRVEPRPAVTYIDAEDTILLGGRQWLIIDTKGHAYGGVMFYEPVLKWMICGDQVLPRITPHVGVLPGEKRSVLYEFMVNLEQLSQYEVELALPGHREPFIHFSERALQIVAHHERRLEQIEQYVQEQGTIDSFTCCEWLFGTHLRDNPHNLRFALTEVIAHLEELVRRGKIQSLKYEQRILFQSN